MRKRLAVAAAICAAFATAPTHAAVMWNFNYIDAGVGFNDPTTGAARQSALESAANYVSSFLTSYTATSTSKSTARSLPPVRWHRPVRSSMHPIPVPALPCRATSCSRSSAATGRIPLQAPRMVLSTGISPTSLESLTTTSRPVSSTSSRPQCMNSCMPSDLHRKSRKTASTVLTTRRALPGHGRRSTSS